MKNRIALHPGEGGTHFRCPQFLAGPTRITPIYSKEYYLGINYLTSNI